MGTPWASGLRPRCLPRSRRRLPCLRQMTRWALGVIAALENAGLSVPDDVSVVGIDDALEGLVPHNRLTTLRFDLRGVGKLAFEAAIGRELVYRGDSCAEYAGRTLDC